MATFSPENFSRRRDSEPIRRFTLASERRHFERENAFNHPRVARRTAVQAGGISLLGLGMNHLAGLRAAGESTSPQTKIRSCIYIFLSGGLSQHDSFDPKPHAPAEIRGEFSAIATQTPGVQICEHLPGLAVRSHLWSMCRSLTHTSNDHSAGHHMMLTGRSDLPLGFNPNQPRPQDWPSIASVAGGCLHRSQQFASSRRNPGTICPLFGTNTAGPIRGCDGKSALRGTLRRLRFIPLLTAPIRLMASTIRIAEIKMDDSSKHPA